jgi:hypothetical protein
MLVMRLLARSTSSCHCEWRSMMRPMGPILLRGRLAVEMLSGGNHCCTALVPAVSAAVAAGLSSACCRLDSANQCVHR